MRPKPLLFFFLLGVTGSSGLLSCKKETHQTAMMPAASSQSSTLQVETQVVVPTSLSADIEVPGTILPNESTEIHAEVPGRIVDLRIKDGATVTQGALLAKLYDADLQAELRKLEVQLQIAEQTEKRQSELLKIQGISQQEYDLSLLQVLNIKADMDILKEGIRKTEIRAPFNGKLGLKNVSPGAYVTPAEILTTISQVNTLKMQFNVPERYGAQLKPGMKVRFDVDGSDESFTASVIASEIEVDEATRSLAVRALVQQRHPALIPGVFAKVSIVFGQRDDALLVPNSAIIPVGRKKQLYVYESGKAMVREVTTGVRDSTNIQVLSGIKAGDTVITSAILYLRPGMEVERSEK